MENLSKSIELLNIPEALGIFNGQLQKKITPTILETVTTDYTNVEVTVNELTGRKTARRVVKVTKSYSVVNKEEKFGGYGLNTISAWMNGFGYEYLGEPEIVGRHELFKDEFQGTVQVGPFTGQTYNFNWSRIFLTKTDSGANLDFMWDQGINVKSDGTPVENEADSRVIIQRRNVVRTGSISIKSTGEFTVSNVRQTTGRPSTTSVTKGYLLESMGVEELDLAEMLKVRFEVKDQPHETHVENIGCDITVTDNKFKGDVFINGIDSEQIPYTTLIASMGLKFPNFVQRWHLYNGEQNDLVYGSTETIVFGASELNEITVVAGNVFSYDAVNKVLTYNQNEPAELRFQFECLPAQGKNEGHTIAIDLKTLEKRYL